MQSNKLGNRYGKLVVIAEAGWKYFERQHTNRRMWLCQCDCGNTKILPSYALTTISRGIYSCGCVKKTEFRGKPKMTPNQAVFITVYNMYQLNAKKRQISFNLTLTQVIHIITQSCYYCGDPPNRIPAIKRTGEITVKVHGIDRIDNNQGYTKTNSVPCCKTCNIMKSTLTENEFKTHIVKIFKNQHLYS